MPRYENPTTGHAIETSNAREGVQLKASGYREVKARKAATRAADEAKASDAK